MSSLAEIHVRGPFAVETLAHRVRRGLGANPDDVDELVVSGRLVAPGCGLVFFDQPRVETRHPDNPWECTPEPPLLADATVRIWTDVRLRDGAAADGFWEALLPLLQEAGATEAVLSMDFDERERWPRA